MLVVERFDLRDDGLVDLLGIQLEHTRLNSSHQVIYRLLLLVNILLQVLYQHGLSISDLQLHLLMPSLLERLKRAELSCAQLFISVLVRGIPTYG